jgi:branched-chain amino acid transport system substrate-binding protein
MKFNLRHCLAAGMMAALTAGTSISQAQEKVVKFGFEQDFTVVYTFVTAEYSQGQRDYLSLVNERGGIKGYKITAEIVDHGSSVPRGIEAYERFKREGVVLIDPLSTPVARALVPRVMADKISMITAYSGRSDAADGAVFPYVMPLSTNYWSQAASLIEYISRQEKNDLKGKRIAFTYIDSGYGREPLPILQELAKRKGFEFQGFPYTSPGTEQSATWTNIRRFKPDWTIIWGAGAGQVVSIKEALRNGIPTDRIASVAWLSESEMSVVGNETAKGILKLEVVAGGREPKIIADIMKEVVGKGKGAGKTEIVGTTYYNMGVAMATLMVEGVRLALEKNPNAAPTAESVNEGLRSITKFTAEGLLPPLTITKTDHQGGGQGRVAQWDGKRWVAKSDWFAADQDIVWQLIKASSDEFRKSGK